MNFIKSNYSFLVILCLFIITVSSCSLINNDDRKIAEGKKDVYEGMYVQGIEDSWFVPCMNIDESWRPLFTGTTFDSVWKALADSESYKIFIRAKGIPSKKGEYMGFFAKYDREFEVIEIIKTRASDSGKCH